MNIGTITFHCAYNFGSVLQAWALKRKLESMGNEVHQIDYRGRDFYQYELIRMDSPRSIVSSLLFYPRNKRRKDSFESFIGANLSCTERYGPDDEVAMRSLADRFDCFICGSDQIWNLDCTHGPTGPFFLSFAGDAKRVSYAPSLAHKAFLPENFDEKDKAFISEQLSKFSAISVREASTAPLFQQLCSKKIETCLDPTLLLDADEYDSITVIPSEAKNTLFVYMLEQNEGLVEYASRMASQMEIAISYVSKRNISFGVPSINLYGIGPSEFLGAIKGSAAVLTNSFHATVFSLLFNAPFLTFATRHSSARMTELLSNLGASGNLVEDSRCREGQMKPPSRASDVKEKLESLRRDSLEFLQKALGE